MWANKPSSGFYYASPISYPHPLPQCSLILTASTPVLNATQAEPVFLQAYWPVQFLAIFYFSH